MHPWISVLIVSILLLGIPVHANEIPRDTSEQVAGHPTPVGDTTQTIQDSLSKETAKSKDADKDDVDRDSLGYKIGYQIGSWLIPGILMVIATIMIYKRSRRGGSHPEV